MYVPRANVIGDEVELRDLVVSVGTAELVTVDADGRPQATLLPVLWDDDRLVFHLARANTHWRTVVPGGPGLAVPTWNYSAVHLTGPVRVHQDPEWLRDAVTRLTDRHEAAVEPPWSVADAPAAYVEQQLRAVVGVELFVERVEGKAKLSQNRTTADQDGVVAGLRATGGGRDAEVARQMTERRRT